jgi:hypothetical protein
MATSPNETVSEPIERGAAMCPLCSSGILSPVTCESLRKALFCRKYIMPPVPGPVQTRRHVESVKSVGSAASSSSQVSGIDTGAPGTPRGE